MTSPMRYGGSERRSDPPLPEWKAEEPTAFRRVAASLVEMALITGVLLRLFRAVILSNGPGDNPFYVGGAFALGALFLLTMVTLHLAKLPLNQWPWRAPAFVVLETAAEMVTSALLIVLHREPLGSVRAEMHDLPAMAASALISRVVTVSVFALLLGIIVQRIRHATVRRDRHAMSAARSSVATSALGNRFRR